MPKQTAPLDAELVRALLVSTRFADVRYFARTASTNTDAQAVLGSPASLGATLVAEYQEAGAGRKGRRWFAPPGSALLFTAMLPAAIDAAGLWAVPFWTALAVAHAVEATCGVALDLVWPNDLHVRGGKAGGILSVARITGNDAWVGCGVGLNVLRPYDDLDLAAIAPAPVFIDDLAPVVSREALLAAILTEFDHRFEDLRDPKSVVERWEERANLAGTIYRYRNDADAIEREGVALCIGPQGVLIVRDGDGGERTIDMADVRVIAHGET